MSPGKVKSAYGVKWISPSSAKIYSWLTKSINNANLHCNPNPRHTGSTRANRVHTVPEVKCSLADFKSAPAVPIWITNAFCTRWEHSRLSATNLIETCRRHLEVFVRHITTREHASAGPAVVAKPGWRRRIRSSAQTAPPIAPTLLAQNIQSGASTVATTRRPNAIGVSDAHMRHGTIDFRPTDWCHNSPQKKVRYHVNKRSSMAGHYYILSHSPVQKSTTLTRCNNVPLSGPWVPSHFH